MEIANSKSNQVLAFLIQQEFLSFFHPELKLLQTLYFGLPCVRSTNILHFDLPVVPEQNCLLGSAWLG